MAIAVDSSSVDCGDFGLSALMVSATAPPLKLKGITAIHELKKIAAINANFRFIETLSR
ncbi:MAG: hypothetical protein AAGA09_04715 [Pseudomonadota bacterium]